MIGDGDDVVVVDGGAVVVVVLVAFSAYASADGDVVAMVTRDTSVSGR